MKITYRLDSNDIIDLISSIYKTDKANIRVFTTNKAQGYGADYREVPDPVVEVTVESGVLSSCKKCNNHE